MRGEGFVLMCRAKAKHTGVMYGKGKVKSGNVVRRQGQAQMGEAKALRTTARAGQRGAVSCKGNELRSEALRWQSEERIAMAKRSLASRFKAKAR